MSGWRTLLGATLWSNVGVYPLVFYTADLFMVALQADIGWSRSAISLGASPFALGLGVAAPAVGALCDRYGEPTPILVGLSVQVAVLLSLSRMETLTSFYWLMGILGLLGIHSRIRKDSVKRYRESIV